VKMNFIITDIHTGKVELIKKDASYITFHPMSIKNIQKLTYNLLKIQHLIIHHWILLT